MRIAIVCFLGSDIIKYETNFTFLVKPFFYMTKKSRKMNKYLVKKHEFLRWNKNHVSSFLKGFQLPKIVSDLRVRL